MKEKKIPTLIAIIFLLVSMISGVFLVKNSSTLFSKASAENSPKLLKLTNINHSGATISWLTDKELGGFITIGETVDQLTRTVFDDRDSSEQVNLYKIHYVTIKNLKASTKYYFKISSGNQLFDESGKPFELTTASVPSGSLPPNDVATGIVVTTSDAPAQGLIVYFSLANMTPQSALTGSAGNWIVPLNTAFSTNLNTYATYDKEAQVAEIFVQGGTAGTATATVTTKNDNPVPKITLGETYDFRQAGSVEEIGGPSAASQAANISPTPSSATSSGLPKISPTTSPSPTTNITIVSPGNEEDLATQKPNIFGTGPANKTLQIKVESPTPYSASIKTDATGNWTYTPPANLAPGEHTVTLTYETNVITRKFTVLAAESSSLPAFTATPSASLAPTKIPTATPTTKPTLTPTIKAGTPTPTLKLAATPTPIIRTSMPSTSSGTPISGSLTPSLFVLIMGIALIMSSFVVKKILAHER
jgi:hypothetical protein